MKTLIEVLRIQFRKFLAANVRTSVFQPTWKVQFLFVQVYIIPCSTCVSTRENHLCIGVDLLACKNCCITVWCSLIEFSAQIKVCNAYYTYYALQCIGHTCQQMLSGLDQTLKERNRKILFLKSYASPDSWERNGHKLHVRHLNSYWSRGIMVTQSV